MRAKLAPKATLAQAHQHNQSLAQQDIIHLVVSNPVRSVHLEKLVLVHQQHHSLAHREHSQQEELLHALHAQLVHDVPVKRLLPQ